MKVTFSHCIYIVAFLFTTCAGNGEICEFDNCLHIYNNLKAVFEETGKGDFALCPYQQELKECMKSRNRKCRGDLNYHFFEKLVRDLMGSTGVGKNCTTKSRPTSSGSDENVLNGSTGHGTFPLDSRRGNSNNNQNPIGGRRQQFLPPTIQDKCGPPKNLENASNSHFSICSIFGLTNLKSFSESLNISDISYCSLNGAWSLIDTPEFAVQITNKGGLSPLPKDITATTLVTVIIKSNQCSERRTYQATFDEVPSMFSDGSVAAGSVLIETIREGEKVKINFPFLSTTIDIIKIIDRLPIPSLSVTIRMPYESANKFISEASQIRGLPLCFYGCPKTAQIRSKTSSETPLKCSPPPPATFSSPNSQPSQIVKNKHRINIAGASLEIVDDELDEDDEDSEEDSEQDEEFLLSSSDESPLKSAVCASLDRIQPLIQGSSVVSTKLIYPGDENFERGSRGFGDRESQRMENSALAFTYTQSAGILSYSRIVIFVTTLQLLFVT